METIWRQKPSQLLTKEQYEEKLKRDSEYEIAVQNIYTNVSLTAEKKKSQKDVLWNNYFEWAKKFGLYEEITPIQQLTEIEISLNSQLERVNLIRAELNKPLLQITEKKA